MGLFLADDDFSGNDVLEIRLHGFDGCAGAADGDDEFSGGGDGGAAEHGCCEEGGFVLGQGFGH